MCWILERKNILGSSNAKYQTHGRGDSFDSEWLFDIAIISGIRKAYFVEDATELTRG
jgi:hypothetical protein